METITVTSEWVAELRGQVAHWKEQVEKHRELGKLAEALSGAQGEFATVEKRSTAVIKMKAGGEFRYKYADLDDVVKMARPVLCKHGLAVSQTFDERLMLTSRLIHKSGQQLASYFQLTSNPDPKLFSVSAMYARRLQYSALLGITTDEDVDAPPQADPHPRGVATEAPAKPEAKSKTKPKAETKDGSFEGQTGKKGAAKKGAAKKGAAKKPTKAQQESAEKSAERQEKGRETIPVPKGKVLPSMVKMRIGARYGALKRLIGDAEAESVLKEVYAAEGVSKLGDVDTEDKLALICTRLGKVINVNTPPANEGEKS